MAKSRFAATVGAAAFIAGVSLAVPQSSAIATADGADAAPASDSPASDSPAPGASRGAKPAPRGAADRSSLSPARAAAPHRPLDEARRGIVARPAAGTGRGRLAPDSAATSVNPSATTDLKAPPVSATVDPAQVDPAPDISVPAPATVPAVNIAAAAPMPPGLAAVTAPARPSTLATVTASAGTGADASSAALIDKLLAPISKLFGEGTALLVRRTFFNQAPTVGPVQLTGQVDGPVTGTIGAVDTEGDPLTYMITSTPLHGSAVVNPDGSYTFTPGTGFSGADNFVVDVTDNAPGFHINLLDFSRPSSTAASVTVTQGVLASMLRFQFVYGTGSQYWSSAARGALESAAARLASNFVVTSPVTVTFEVTGEKSAFSTTLASAGSDFVSGSEGFLQTVVQNKILRGEDANGSAADGTIDWNFGPSWAFGNTVPNSQYDFQSTAVHEMLHAFGFMSNIDKAGSNTGKVWTVFDSYVVNQAGTRVINGGNYTWNPAYNSNLTGGNDGLYFGGPNAVAANLGPVALYTPKPWEPGSSLSHLKANYLMNAIVDLGPGIREISPVELSILSDIGYTVTSGSGTPVLLFFGFVTLRVRRRRD